MVHQLDIKTKAQHQSVYYLNSLVWSSIYFIVAEAGNAISPQVIDRARHDAS